MGPFQFMLGHSNNCQELGQLYRVPCGEADSTEVSYVIQVGH